MKQVISAILVLLLLFLSPMTAFASGVTLPSGVETSSIGSRIEAFVSEHEDTTAGMAVAVFDRSETIYRNWFGYEDKAAGLKVDAETVFEWGSVTKLLVWVSVMQLWEQGRIDLDADVRDYLPDGFLRNLEYGTPVTMLHLMNHNAGFEDSIVGMLTPDEENIIGLETYLSTIQPRQVFQPGTVTAYSNWGVTLAGYIVERISGMPFYAYVQDHIFDPLGMEHSALNADLSDNPWVQTRREELECYTTGGVLIPGCVNYFNCYPAGMCTSTLEDLTAFAMALLDRESPLFSDPATHDALMTPTAWFPGTEIPMNCHGLWALESYGVPVLGHGGNTTGCSANLLLDLENGIGLVVMTNQSNEQIYNQELPELVFGPCRHERLDFTGYVSTARTVFRGPLKLYQLLGTTYLTPEDSEGFLCVLHETDGKTVITVPHGQDYQVRTLPELILHYLPLMLWAAALVFSLISLIAMGISALVCKLRRRYRVKPLRKWAALSCATLLLPFGAVVPAVLSLLSNNQWLRWQYQAVFGAFLVFAVLHGVLAVCGIYKMWKRRSVKVFHIAVAASLVIGIVNILYWELGYFWLI